MNISEGRWWSLILSSFTHLDIPHLLLNSYSLYQLSPGILAEFPLIYVVAAYFLSAYISSYVAIIMNPTIGTVGASGSIYCLDAMLISVILRSYEVDYDEVIFDIILPLVIAEGKMWFNEDNISHWSHFSGFIVGLVLGHL